VLIRFVLFCLIFVGGLVHAQGAAVELSEAEIRWLDEHRDTLRIGIAEVPPQQAFLNSDGKLEGLAIEYIDAVEQALGVRFERVLLPSYGEMMRQAQNRDIDIVYAASRTSVREQFLDFTRPYNYVANNIFVRTGEDSFNNLARFSGQPFAATAGTAVAEYVRRNYPDVELVPVRSSREAFNLLAAGQVQGVGATAASAYKHVYEAGLHNIALVGPLGYDYAISMAARSDWSELGHILQKGLDSLSEEQISAIQSRWNRPADETRIDLEVVREYLILAGLVIVLLVSAGLLWWLRALKREIGQREQAEARLSYLAYHDEVTGMTNRTGFMQQLEKRHTSDKPYTLMLLGLDQFGTKNELWGQKIGNEILRTSAQRLQSQLAEDAIAGRVGGDEFAVLFESTDTVNDLLFEQILREIRRPMMLDESALQVISATAGVVQVAGRNGRAELSLQQAEVALKHAKREQRGHFMCYEASMGRSDSRDQLWKEQLMLAIDHNQLFLEYQPQLDLQAHKVVGFEALVRWQHPEQGRVSPAEFIPMAERTGLISALGDWVLQTACRQACRWRKEGLSFEYIAVNVSVRQFADADFSRKVMQVLKETGLPAGCLELEITETLFMNQYDAVRATLDELSRQGVRFSIDDFGTGFSSLLYLKQLPVETLKLAQEFVLDIAEDASSLEIVNAATSLGHSLGMRIIAEGVEGEEVEKILQQLDCDLVQGYLYSRPVPASQVSKEWIEQLSWQSEAAALERNTG